MKKWLVVMLCMPLIALAQDFGGLDKIEGFDQGSMEKMLSAAKEAQACMEKVDQAELQALQARAEEMIAEVEALCEAGDADEARSLAVSYGREIEAEPVMQDMKECAGMIQQQIPAMVWTELEEPGRESTDVCNY